MEENNKLIAEFMGLSIDIFKALTIDKGVQADYMEWNWLMPVVEKIEYIESITHGNQFQVIIREEEVGIYDKHTQTHIVYIPADGESKLTNTYKAVVEFIKEYNKNN